MADESPYKAHQNEICCLTFDAKFSSILNSPLGPCSFCGWYNFRAGTNEWIQFTPVFTRSSGFKGPYHDKMICETEWFSGGPLTLLLPERCDHCHHPVKLLQEVRYLEQPRKTGTCFSVKQGYLRFLYPKVSHSQVWLSLIGVTLTHRCDSQSQVWLWMWTTTRLLSSILQKPQYLKN